MDGRESDEDHPHGDQPPAGPSCHGSICPTTPRTAVAIHKRGLFVALLITTVVMFAEVAGGILSNSLALLADAGHMLTDVAALGLSLFAVWFAGRPASYERSYGYRRIEILAALTNGVTLVTISILIFFEAYERLQDPPQVESGLMLAVACVGLAANLAAAGVLARSGAQRGGHGHDHAHGHVHGRRDGGNANLNIRGAYLHVLGDALGSVGAIAAAIAIWGWGWKIADPIFSAAIGVIVLVGAVRLVLQSVDVLMESTPAHLDARKVHDALTSIEGVRSIHDLHVWTIGGGMHVLTVHAVFEPARTPCRDELLHRIVDRIRRDFEIDHATVQLESPRSSAIHAHADS